MDGYQILNSVKPAWEQTRFPYSSIAKQQVQFTLRQLAIMAKKVDEHRVSKHTPVTGSASYRISFYGCGGN